MKKIIEIYWDDNPTCAESYLSGLYYTECGISFQTCCLEFFDFDYLGRYDDVVVISYTDNGYISLRELLDNTGEYTDKEIRKTYDARKMLVAGALKFKKGTYNAV